MQMQTALMSLNVSSCPSLAQYKHFKNVFPKFHGSQFLPLQCMPHELLYAPSSEVEVKRTGRAASAGNCVTERRQNQNLELQLCSRPCYSLTIKDGTNVFISAKEIFKSSFLPQGHCGNGIKPWKWNELETCKILCRHSCKVGSLRCTWLVWVFCYRKDFRKGRGWERNSREHMFWTLWKHCI